MSVIATTVAKVGGDWVAKLLNKQPKNVSPYFSRNGQYQADVNRQKGLYNDAFSNYAKQLPEGSAEAKEFLQICKPALDWMGQRNAPGITSVATINTEGQRLLNQYQSKSIVGKAADVINTAIDPDTLTKLIDPIKNFFSFLSLTPPTEQAYLAAPKTDTIIPITIEPTPVTVLPGATAATQEKTGFEKFALPVGIAVVSGVVLLMLRR